MSGEDWRLFVALELPPEVRRALAEWAAPLAGPALRPAPEDALHVTLCFLGGVAGAERAAVAAAIPPPAGSLCVEAMRPRWLPVRRPRVLAVELADVDGTLTRFQGALAAALAAGGWYRPEPRRYLPHVTVARVRWGALSGPPALEEVPRLRVRPSAVALMRSHLGRGPARYERLAVWPIR